MSEALAELRRIIASDFDPEWEDFRFAILYLPNLKCVSGGSLKRKDSDFWVQYDGVPHEEEILKICGEHLSELKKKDVWTHCMVSVNADGVELSYWKPNDISLPDSEMLPSCVLNENKGCPKRLERTRKRAAKGFKWSKAATISNLVALLEELFLCEHYDDVDELAGFLSQYRFRGDHNVWSRIETALSYQWRVLRDKDKAKAESAKARIMAIVPSLADRLSRASYNQCMGNVKTGVDHDDAGQEFAWRMNLLGVLSKMICCGGAPDMGVGRLEDEFQNNLSRLKELY